MSVSRSHVVDGLEDVTVEAGKFAAVRVSFDEQAMVQGKSYSSSGVFWLAPEVGLVKLVSDDEAGQTRQDLIAYGQ